MKEWMRLSRCRASRPTRRRWGEGAGINKSEGCRRGFILCRATTLKTRPAAAFLPALLSPPKKEPSVPSIPFSLSLSLCLAPVAQQLRSLTRLAYPHTRPRPTEGSQEHSAPRCRPSWMHSRRPHSLIHTRVARSPLNLILKRCEKEKDREEGRDFAIPNSFIFQEKD